MLIFEHGTRELQQALVTTQTYENAFRRGRRSEPTSPTMATVLLLSKMKSPLPLEHVSTRTDIIARHHMPKKYQAKDGICGVQCTREDRCVS